MKKSLSASLAISKTCHVPTEDPDVGRFKDDFKDWLLRVAFT
jgi:hypothetical protein